MSDVYVFGGPIYLRCAFRMVDERHKRGTIFECDRSSCSLGTLGRGTPRREHDRPSVLFVGCVRGPARKTLTIMLYFLTISPADGFLKRILVGYGCHSTGPEREPALEHITCSPVLWATYI